MYDLRPFLDAHPDFRKRDCDWATYGVSWLPLAASAVAQEQDAIISADADFLVCQFKLYVTLADNVTAVDPAPLTFLLRDQGQSRNLTTVALHSSAIMVNEGFNTLPYPHLLQKQSTFAAIVTNLNATAYQVWLTLEGVKFF